MEPVPETEKLVEFRSAPVPSLRLHHSNYHPQSSLSDSDSPRKPPVMSRRATDPNPSSPVSPTWSAASLPYRPRTTSPLSGFHTRSKSAAALAPAPMGRANSLPGVNGLGHIMMPRQRSPSSPTISPSRARAMRKPADEAYPSLSPTRSSVLDLEPPLLERNSVPGLGHSHSMVRNRRPSSPLLSVAGTITPASPSVTSSPLHRPYDSFNDGFSYTHSSYPPSSSMPSTPISMRSRSPSISSLETIPDTPDAEDAAVEADKDRIAQLKAAADAEDAGDSKGRSSLDMPARGRTMGGFGTRDKRKRWSVCGGERRADLDLETIWED